MSATSVGQMFAEGIYFWGRPSYASDGYGVSGSAGSNGGPTSEEYFVRVKARIDTFLLHHSYLQHKGTPTKMVTTSVLGLDPDVTSASAYVQVERVAEIRGMGEATVRGIVDKTAEKPLLGLFGAARVNVLRLDTVSEKINGK